MGKRAAEVRRATRRLIRKIPLSEEERSFLRQSATYEGSPHHKRSPGDFGLTPPAAPRPDKTLCDEAGVMKRAIASDLLQRAIERGLASEAVGAPRFPKQLWAIDAEGQVFEAMYGGSKLGAYHGYPIRQSDPLFDEITEVWGRSDV